MCLLSFELFNLGGLLYFHLFPPEAGWEAGWGSCDPRSQKRDLHPTDHPEGNRLSVGTPALHPTDHPRGTRLSVGTPALHPTDEDLSVGTPDLGHP